MALHIPIIGVSHLAWPNNGLTETFPYVMGRGLTIPWYITWTMLLLDMEVFCAGGVDDNGTKHEFCVSIGKSKLLGRHSKLCDATND